MKMSTSFKIQFQYYAALIAHTELTGYKQSLNVKEIQATFSNLMNSNEYNDTFLDVLYPTSEHSEDFLPQLKKALESLAIEIPQNYQEAVYGILRYHLSRIVEGTTKPITGMLEISFVLGYNDGEGPTTDTQNFQDNDLITEEIIQLIDDCWYNRSEFDVIEPFIHYRNVVGDLIPEMEADIMEGAKRWLEEHGG